MVEVLGNIIFQRIIWGSPEGYPKYISHMLHSQLRVSRTNGIPLLNTVTLFIVLTNADKKRKTNDHVNIYIYIYIYMKERETTSNPLIFY